MIKNNQPGDLNQVSLENVVFKAKKLISIMTSLILRINPTSKTLLTFYLTSMKLLAILVMICRLTHQNNSNYVFLLVAIYIYSASIKVD